jgi:hypothetical protein
MSKLRPFFHTHSLFTYLQSIGHQLGNVSTRRSSLLLYKVPRLAVTRFGRRRLKRKRKQWHDQIKCIFHTLSLFTYLQSVGHQFENFSTSRSSLLLYKVPHSAVTLFGRRRLKRKRKQWHEQIKSDLSHPLTVYLPAENRTPVWKRLDQPIQFVVV